MKNVVLKCKNICGDFDIAWKNKINFFLEKIDIYLINYFSNAILVINSIERKGCDFNIKYSLEKRWPLYFDKSKIENEHVILDILESQFAMLRNELEMICPKCGQNKGKATSFFVRTGLCEICRKNITIEDFKNTFVIGIIGKAGAGKDTVCDYLVSKNFFQRMALADPLRDILQIVLVSDRLSIVDRNLRELPLRTLNKMKDESYWTGRKLLQYVGTEMFRNLVDDNIWVKNLYSRMEPNNNYIITDVRFPNEVEFLKQNFKDKCLLIEVIRDGYDGKSVGISGHASETSVLFSDIKIYNNGTLEELYNSIEENVVSKIRGVM